MGDEQSLQVALRSVGAQHFFMHFPKVWEIATKDSSSSIEKTLISVTGILVWEPYKVTEIYSRA